MISATRQSQIAGRSACHGVWDAWSAVVATAHWSMATVSSSSHHGDTESWKAFSQGMYIQKHPWLLAKSDNIYFQCCSVCQCRVQRKASVFIYSPYVGKWPDKQLQPAELTRKTQKATESLGVQATTKCTTAEVMCEAVEKAFKNPFSRSICKRKERLHTP